MPHLQEFELGWLAFRYVAGEMTAEELDSFEQRLAQDQSAREAVAQAVDLTRAVLTVSGPTLPVTHNSAPLPATVAAHRGPVSNWIRSSRWVAAAAAILLAGLAIERTLDRRIELATLARVWANVLVGQARTGPTETGRWAETDESYPGQAEEDDLAVPSWLLEAVGYGSDQEKWEDS